MNHYTSRTDQPWWSDVTRDECGQPIDRLVIEREYEPELDGVLHSEPDDALAQHIRHIWLRAAGQMELDFDPRDLALFSDLMEGAA